MNVVRVNEADMSVTQHKKSAKWLTTPEQVFFVVVKLATIRALKPWLTVQQHVVLEKYISLMNKNLVNEMLTTFLTWKVCAVRIVLEQISQRKFSFALCA